MGATWGTAIVRHAEPHPEGWTDDYDAARDVRHIYPHATGSAVAVITAFHQGPPLTLQDQPSVDHVSPGDHWRVCHRATSSQDCPLGHFYDTETATVREDDGGPFVGVTLPGVPLAWVQRERVRVR